MGANPVTNLAVELQAAVDAAFPPAEFSKICQVITGKTEKFNVFGLGAAPKMAAVDGDIKTYRPGRYEYNLTVSKYGVGLEIEVDDITDHVIGDQLTGLIQDLAQNARNFYMDHFLDTVLSALSTQTTYDGIAFFNASHPYNGGTTTNLATSSASSTGAITTAEGVTAYRAMKTAMGKIYNDQGQRANRTITDMVLFCGINNGTIMQQLFSKEDMLLPGGSGAPNPYRNENVTVVATPEIAEATMYLFNTSSMAHKPIICAEQFGVKAKEGAENVTAGTKPVVVYNKFDMDGLRWQKAVKLTIS